MQAHAENHRERHDTLYARRKRLLDPPGELQIAPDHDVYGSQRDDRRLEDRRHPRGVLADVARELTVQPGPECPEEFHGSAPSVSGRRLEARRELTLSGNRALPAPLLVGPVLRLRRGNQHVELVALVFEHRLLGTDARAEVQDALLIACHADRVDELLQSREPAAGVGQSLPRYGLQQRRRVTILAELLLPVWGQRVDLLRCEYRVLGETLLDTG